jgi:hypothetical protein
LPYSDVLTVRHRGEYLDILKSLKDRRRILSYISEMDYQNASSVVDDLKSMSKAYDELMFKLREVSLEFGDFLYEDEKLWYEMTGAKTLHTDGNATEA